jgi:hypothetical protein
MVIFQVIFRILFILISEKTKKVTIRGIIEKLTEKYITTKEVGIQAKEVKGTKKFHKKIIQK